MEIVDNKKEIYLYHHGIRHQRWGIRRFQNEDGSLTPEGRERYGVSNSVGSASGAGAGSAAGGIRRSSDGRGAGSIAGSGRRSSDGRGAGSTPRNSRKSSESRNAGGAVPVKSGSQQNNSGGVSNVAKTQSQEAKKQEENRFTLEEKNEGSRFGLEEKKNSSEKGGGSDSNKPKTTEIPKYSKDKSGLSDKDLVDILKRKQLEDQYDDKFNPEKIARRERQERFNNQKQRLDSVSSVARASSSLANSTSNFVKSLPNDTKIIKAKKVDLSNYSNQELQEMITRANLERQWNNTFNPDKVVVNKGRERTIQMLEMGAAGLSVVGSAVSVASAIADLRAKRS